jgi:RecA-family ATPase
MNQAMQSAEADAPIIVRLDTVTPRKVLWLWHHRIPRGKLTLIAGDGGIGKSLLTMDIAQRVSSGRPWPDSLCEPNPAGGVVIVSAEDDVDDTIVPRLKAAGADLARIVANQGGEYTDEKRKRRGLRSFNLQADMPALEAAIDATDGCSLVIIDPVTAFMGKV